MFRTIAVALLIVSVPIIAAQGVAAKKSGCRSCGEEIPQARRAATSRSVQAPWFGPAPDVKTNEAVPRRRAYFYSWQGSCYARDRSRQWRWVDPGFC
jgi:hypothetical protein